MVIRGYRWNHQETKDRGYKGVVGGVVKELGVMEQRESKLALGRAMGCYPPLAFKSSITRGSNYW